MTKEIPKREGQRLNGIGPSAAALALLMIIVPVISTYLISGAIYLSDEPLVASYEKNDVLLGEWPFYEKSGDGPDSKCDSGILTYSSANCTASAQTWGSIYNIQSHQGTYYQKLPGCANGSSHPTLSIYDCGDSDFRITQNITSRLAVDYTFPTISYNFTEASVEQCDWTRMGDSKVDYTIKLSHYKRSPLFHGTNIWTYGYVHESITVSDTFNFNSSFIDSIGYNANNVPNYYSCKSKINVVHNFDFVDLDNLNRMVDDYLTNGSESIGFYITIELDNLRTEKGYSWDSKNWDNPFHGGNSTYVDMYLDLVFYEVDPMNTFIRFGVMFMGIGFWTIAIASTPLWDPFIKKVAGVK